MLLSDAAAKKPEMRHEDYVSYTEGIFRSGWGDVNTEALVTILFPMSLVIKPKVVFVLKSVRYKGPYYSNVKNSGLQTSFYHN